MTMQTATVSGLTLGEAELAALVERHSCQIVATVDALASLTRTLLRPFDRELQLPIAVHEGRARAATCPGTAHRCWYEKGFSADRLIRSSAAWVVTGRVLRSARPFWRTWRAVDQLGITAASGDDDRS